MRLLLRLSAFAVIALIALIGEGSSIVQARGGDLLAQISRPSGCFDSKQGIGVAFYRYNFNIILYTCQNPSNGAESTSIFRTGMTGVDDGSFVVKDDFGHEVPMEAIAWDSAEQLLWGVGRIPSRTDPIDGICAVWRIDVISSTGRAQLAFWFSDPGGGCDFTPQNFVDGLTVDPGTDSIYLSFANGSQIRHFYENGARAPNDPIDFSSLTEGVCGGSSCRSSGLIFGADGSLLSATGLAEKLVRLDPNTPSLVDVYDTEAGGSWDLECGPMFAARDGSLKATILSADLLSSMINVLEAPEGVCKPMDYALRELRLTPRGPFKVGVGDELTVSVTGQAGGFNYLPQAFQKANVLLHAALPPSPMHGRFMAHPGDSCYTYGRWGHLDPIPCSEGDRGGYYPSMGGQTCYDGLDNDGNGLIDNQDPNCMTDIEFIQFAAGALDQFETFQRDLILQCTDAASVKGQITASISPWEQGIQDTTHADDADVIDLIVRCSKDK